jgi:BspA type Leucine rich repeat region (6 copies)
MTFLRRLLWLSGLAAASSPALVRQRGWTGVSRGSCRSIARTPCSRRLLACLRTDCATWLLPLLLLTPPAALQAQFTYFTNNGAITITGLTNHYWGAVVIPDRLPDPTNGLPVSAIGESAFSSQGITNVIIPNGVISIGNYAFEGCKGLGKVIIGNSVIIIGDHAFDGCEYLSNLAIPDSVISIGPYAFRFCALTNIPTGRGLTSIEDYTFIDCGYLTNITIPSNITSIGAGAFSGCFNLTRVYFPSSVTSIGDGAFSQCFKLAEAYFEGDAPNGGSLDVFQPPTTVYYLPGTTRWGSTFGGSLAVLWNPQAQNAGVRFSRFGFNITGPTNIPFVVEVSTNLGRASWTALQTCTLTNGSVYFSDPQSTKYPPRFYRLRSP